MHISKAEKSVVAKRALRHKNPILIIPFFRDTREEELVRKWMKNYNKELIKIVYNLEKL